MSELAHYVHFALTWAGDPLELHVDERPFGRTRRLDGVLNLLAGEWRLEASPGGSRGTLLWAQVEGSEQERHAFNFKPLPSLVLRLGGGTRRLLCWLLDAPASWHEIERANRRIAYRLRAVQRHGEHSELRIPVGGVWGPRSLPVSVTRMELAEHPLEAIAGRLREPPERRRSWAAA